MRLVCFTWKRDVWRTNQRLISRSQGNSIIRPRLKLFFFVYGFSAFAFKGTWQGNVSRGIRWSYDVFVFLQFAHRGFFLYGVDLQTIWALKMDVTHLIYSFNSCISLPKVWLILRTCGSYQWHFPRFMVLTYNLSIYFPASILITLAKCFFPRLWWCFTWRLWVKVERRYVLIFVHVLSAFIGPLKLHLPIVL